MLHVYGILQYENALLYYLPHDIMHTAFARLMVTGYLEYHTNLSIEHIGYTLRREIVQSGRRL